MIGFIFLGGQKIMYMKFPGHTIKTFTMSYDDDTVHNARLIEIMQKYGLKGTFNLNSGCFAAKSGEGHMTEQEAVEVFSHAGNGIEIAMHGVRHGFLHEMTPSQKSYELVGDKAALEKKFGVIIRGGAYAYGQYDDQSVEILHNADIRYFRTTVSTERFDLPKQSEDWLKLPATCHHENPRLFEIADRFINLSIDPIEYRNHPQMFYLWGHSYEFHNNRNWDRIEELAKKLAGREDIWFATNIEIYDYVKAYSDLITSADGKRLYNTSAQTLYFAHNGVDYTLGGGKTLCLD